MHNFLEVESNYEHYKSQLNQYFSELILNALSDYEYMLLFKRRLFISNKEVNVNTIINNSMLIINSSALNKLVFK